ncbi:hypothetical protein IAR50_002594 [Cryptococcus sp. DSM 104548]
MSHSSHISFLENQLSTTTHELELATFLNKGILQTNTEHKLRIAELESENSILRTAEGKLGDTEDLLEEREKEMDELRGEVERSEEQRERMEAEVEKERELRGRAERERDKAVRELEKERRDKGHWERRYAELAGLTDQYWNEMRRMKEGYGEIDIFGSMGALPSVPSSFERRKTNMMKPAEAASASSSSKKSRPSRAASASAPRQSVSKFTCLPPERSESPQDHSEDASSPLKRPVREAVKKRKRIAESDDEYEEDQAEEYIPSLPRGVKREPVDQTPSRHVQPPTQRVPFSSKSTKSRNNPRHSNERRGPMIKVKDEPVSPPPYVPTEDESDDDPL